jgi:hypothetical protein
LIQLVYKQCAYWIASYMVLAVRCVGKFRRFPRIQYTFLPTFTCFTGKSSLIIPAKLKEISVKMANLNNVFFRESNLRYRVALELLDGKMHVTHWKTQDNWSFQCWHLNKLWCVVFGGVLVGVNEWLTSHLGHLRGNRY